MKNQLSTQSVLPLGMIAIIALLSTSPAHAQREGGSNVGGSEDHTASTYNDPWSDGVVDTLTEYQLIAVQNFADGNTLLAIQQYKTGLEEVLRTARTQQNRLSWTYKMAERSLELSSRLEAQADRTNEKELRATMLSLESAFEQIIANYYQLDVRFFTPYRSICAGIRIRDRYNVQEFEKVLRSYALLQIQWFQSKFVMTVNNEGVAPRYNSKIFLITLSSVAKGLSQDLGVQSNDRNPNLFPLAYGQASRSLAKLSDRIEQHLAGNSIFGSDQRAVNASYTNLLQIISYINR